MWVLIKRSTRLGLALAVALAGCAIRTPRPPDPAPLEHRDYVIGIYDYLRIHVWRNPELSMDVVVRLDGQISLPLLDGVQAEGLTPMELKEVLAREFSEFVTEPDVTVIVIRMGAASFPIDCGGIRGSIGFPLTQDPRARERALEAICNRPPERQPPAPERVPGPASAAAGGVLQNHEQVAEISEEIDTTFRKR